MIDCLKNWLHSAGAMMKYPSLVLVLASTRGESQIPLEPPDVRSHTFEP